MSRYDCEWRMISRSRSGARVAVSALIAATFLMVPIQSGARAAEGYFLGDSIGDDTARTIGLRGAAKTSVHLRRAGVLPQFARLPKGAIALMSLGLNDAADPYQSLTGDIERVIAAAEKTGEKFVWIGPPCVLKGWDKRNAELDAYLAERLAKTSIQYVSLRDPEICRSGMRSRDGEHFTPAGYRYVWQKIQRDSTYAAEVTVGKVEVAVAAETAQTTEAAEAPDKAEAVIVVPKPRRAHRAKSQRSRQSHKRQASKRRSHRNRSYKRLSEDWQPRTRWAQ